MHILYVLRLIDVIVLQGFAQHPQYFFTQTYEIQLRSKETLAYKKALQIKLNHFPYSNQMLIPSENIKSHHPLSEPRKTLVL